MNKTIMRQAGFSKEVEDFEKNNCPFCHKKIDLKDFTDAVSVREYRILGLCQKCQDKTYGGGR